MNPQFPLEAEAMMMMSFCSYCYLPTDKLLTCGKCKKRKFCSKECQKLDWKDGHKLYCEKAGEINFDYEIRDAGYAGLGMFALRDFHKNDTIMVERPLFFTSDVIAREPFIPESARAAVEALVPTDGTIVEKIYCNRISVRDDRNGTPTQGESALFVTMSRVNHHCIGNSDHQYMAHRGVRILVARCDIAQGEEITFAYVEETDRQIRQRRLSLVYGFDCTCNICNNMDIEMNRKLCRIKELDDGIMENASMGRIDTALRQGHALLHLYDEMNYSTWSYNRTYYDLFQVAITKKKFCKDGVKYIRKAMEAVLAYTGGDSEHPLVLEYKSYIQSPQQHRNYLLCD